MTNASDVYASGSFGDEHDLAGEARQPVSLLSLPWAVYGTDAFGIIQWFDEAAVELWGRRPEVCRDHWSEAVEFYTTEGRRQLAEDGPVAQMLQKGHEVPAQEIIFKRFDGSKRLILSRPRLIMGPDGQIAGAVDMLTDLTNIKPGMTQGHRLEDMSAALEEKVKVGIAAMALKHGELKQSEERYHRMIAEVEDYAILLLDAGGFIQNWNIGAEKIKGYKEKEIVGHCGSAVDIS